jgi:hypothetical protein
MEKSREEESRWTASTGSMNSRRDNEVDDSHRLEGGDATGR